MYILENQYQYQKTSFGHSWPSSGLTVPTKISLYKSCDLSYDADISTPITVRLYLSVCLSIYLSICIYTYIYV